MEEINNIANILMNTGGTVIMAVLFIIFLFYDRKDRKEKETKKEESNNKLLSELSASNRNIAESLNLLKTSLDNTNSEFRQHDERAIEQFSNIKQDLTILKERR